MKVVSRSIVNYNTKGSPATCKVTKYCELRYEMKEVSRSTANYTTNGSPATGSRSIAKYNFGLMSTQISSGWRDLLVNTL